MPATLTLRRTQEPDDFNVLSGDAQVGGIYRTHQNGEPWFWCILCFGPGTAADMGFAADLDAAKAALKASWEKSVAAGRAPSETIYSMPSAGSNFGAP